MSAATATDMTVATTILEQLGGRRFTLMTGARLYVGAADHLRFKLATRGKDRGNIVKITLTPMDTYTIETYRLERGSPVLCSQREGVYADNLQAVFTAITGLDTRL